MENLRPNAQRARNAMIFTWLLVLIEVAAAISNYWQHDLLQTAISGGSVTQEEALANDFRVQVISMVYLAVYIVFMIMLIQWFRRAYFNLHQKIDGLSFSEGWAAGGWLIPYISWIRPFQIMRELYQKTQELLRNNGKDFNYSMPLLYTWWGFWVATVIMSIIMFNTSNELTENTTAEKLLRLTNINLFTNALSIPTFLLTFFVIRNYARIEPLIPETTTSKKDEDLSMHLVSTDTKSK